MSVFTNKEVINDVDELASFVYHNAYGEDIGEVEDYIIRCGGKEVDSWIDDGGDEEGEYVIGASYDIGRHHIKLYFSSEDTTIECVEMS